MGPLGLMICIPIGIWWCARLYYRTRGKGYYPAVAATVTFGGMVVAFSVELTGVVLLDSETWSDTAIDLAMLLLVPVAALAMTALVALLPRRPRRAGPRRSWVLSSPAGRVLEVGLPSLFIAMCAGIFAGRVLFGYDSSMGSAITQWERLLVQSTSLLVLGYTALRFARQ